MLMVREAASAQGSEDTARGNSFTFTFTFTHTQTHKLRLDEMSTDWQTATEAGRRTRRSSRSTAAFPRRSASEGKYFYDASEGEA